MPALSSSSSHFVGLAMAALALPTSAQQQQRWQPDDPDRTTITMRQSIGEPLATSGLSTNHFQRHAELPTARQTMLWAQRDRWAVGIGFEQRIRLDGAMRMRPLDALPAQDGGMVVGLALNAGPQMQLTVQTPLLNAPRYQFSPTGELLQPGDEVREIRMGLEFRNTDRLRDLRRGMLMKVELSKQTTLAVKPRAGRVAIMVSKDF